MKKTLKQQFEKWIAERGYYSEKGMGAWRITINKTTFSVKKLPLKKKI